MKKFTILLIVLFTALVFTNAATYTIKKDGGIQNPNGRIQRRVNTNTINQYPKTTGNNYNSGNKDDEVMYTKAQESETPKTETRHKIINRNTTSPNVDKEKALNEKYLQMRDPDINILNIVSKYSRDPNAASNRQAILNNKKTANGCYITTFSDKSVYSISCDSTYAYYYESINNPILTAFDYTKSINTDTYTSYKYTKDKNHRWEVTARLIGYNSIPPKQFAYEKVNNGYVLNSYYIGNRNYSPEGKLNHTRYTYLQE